MAAWLLSLPLARAWHRPGRRYYVTPRSYLDLINLYGSLLATKRQVGSRSPLLACRCTCLVSAPRLA